VARALVMDAKDNVATVLEDLQPGQEVEVEGGKKPLRMRAAEAIPFGHKIALAPIPSRGKVLKYGEVIGRATRSIPAGAHVHVHNIKSTRR